LGPAAYLVTGAIEAWRHRSFQATLELDGVERTLRTQQIIITNGRFFGTTPLGGADQVVSERLLVLGLEGTTPWELARFWAAMLAGHPEWLREVHTRSVRELRIVTRPHRSIELDGEVRVRTPATFSVLPKALRVFVPAKDGA
jgi:diacylglycerol kinase family enzyme